MELGAADMAEAEAKQLAPGYQRAIGIYWKHLLRYYGDAATLADITYDSVRAYEGERRKTGARGQSIREEVACLKRAFKIAYRRRQITVRPDAEDWPRIEADAPDEKRRGKLVAIADMRAVLALLRPEVADELVFVALTGLRREELPEVRAGWLVKDAKGQHFIQVPGAASKTGEPRTIALPGLALEVFRRRVEAFGDGALFPYRNFKRHIRTCCKLAGCPRITYRDLRTTFATIAAANADLASVRDAMGHTGVVTTNIYLRGQDEGRAKAGRAVQRVLLGKGEEE